MAIVVAAHRGRCWGWDMKILIFGGTGFVGLNIAAALLARGHAVILFDRANLPAAAQHDFAGYGDGLTVIQGDVTDRQAVMDVVAGGHDRFAIDGAFEQKKQQAEHAERYADDGEIGRNHQHARHRNRGL